jgi:hypothetical protein
MSFKRSPLLYTLAIAFWGAHGQTAVDISNKYPVVNAYQVRPGIVMTAKYADDGQVCEMVLEKRHKTTDGADFDSTIPHEVVRQLLDELVPTAERGKTTKRYFRGSDSESTILGNVEITESEYENVSIRIFGGVSSPGLSGDVVITIRWKKRTCAATQSASVAMTKPNH